jgi:proline dehydrogenase
VTKIPTLTYNRAKSVCVKEKFKYIIYIYIYIYIMFKIITYFIITLFARLYVRVGILVTFGKDLITYFNNWAHTTS